MLEYIHGTIIVLLIILVGLIIYHIHSGQSGCGCMQSTYCGNEHSCYERKIPQCGQPIRRVGKYDRRGPDSIGICGDGDDEDDLQNNLLADITSSDMSTDFEQDGFVKDECSCRGDCRCAKTHYPELQSIEFRRMKIHNSHNKKLLSQLRLGRVNSLKSNRVPSGVISWDQFGKESMGNAITTEYDL